MRRHKHCFQRAKAKLPAHLAVGTQEAIDDGDPLRDSRMRAGQVEMEERRKAIADLIGEATRLLKLDQHQNQGHRTIKQLRVEGQRQEKRAGILRQPTVLWQPGAAQSRRSIASSVATGSTGAMLASMALRSSSSVSKSAGDEHRAVVREPTTDDLLSGFGGMQISEPSRNRPQQPG